MPENLMHESLTVDIGASAAEVFDYLDSPARFGAHMKSRSMAMFGGRMDYELDDQHGQAIGSRIKGSGNMLGMTIAFDERITERQRPLRKAWETNGKQRLIVLDWYKMGFQIAPKAGGSALTVFIDYIPSRIVGLGGLVRSLARSYALWCVRKAAEDARNAFKLNTANKEIHS